MPTSSIAGPPASASLGSWPRARWWLALALAILVAHEAHELIHTATGRRLCGAWGTRDFNVWALAPGCTAWLPTLVGPLLSWVIMWIGVLLLRDTRESLTWPGIALVFAPNPLGRLLPALLGGGDEGVIARRLLDGTGVPPRLVVVASAALFVLPPLLVAWRTLAVPLAIPRRVLCFVLLLFSGILVTGPLLFVVGNGLLSRGVLATPGLFGAPQLVEYVTLVTSVLLVWRWRDLRRDTTRSRTATTAYPPASSSIDDHAAPARISASHQ